VFLACLVGLVGIIVWILSPAKPTQSPNTNVVPAGFDEASAILIGCGQSQSDSVLENGRREIKYEDKYDTYLYFDHNQGSWKLDSVIGWQNGTLNETFGRMPCLRTSLGDHWNDALNRIVETAVRDERLRKSRLGLDDLDSNPVAARKQFAQRVDAALLDEGIESTTTTSGADASIIVIRDPLAGRVRAKQLQTDNILSEQLLTLGFTKLKYTNGYDVNFTWVP
jgi:hypothetical protein